MSTSPHLIEIWRDRRSDARTDDTPINTQFPRPGYENPPACSYVRPLSHNPAAMLLSGIKSSVRHISKAPLLITMSAVRSAASHATPATNVRPAPDKVLQDISDYVHTPEKTQSPLARETARLCLIDTLGCGLEALKFKQCTKLLGPVVEGMLFPSAKEFMAVQVRPFRTEPKSPGRITNLIRLGGHSILVR